MEARGVRLDPAPIQRWVVKYRARLEKTFHRRKRPVGRRWRLDETDMRVNGEWQYVDRAVDTSGPSIDVLLTEHRDTEAARRFLTHAIHRHGVPETITIDGSAAHEAAIQRYHEAHGTHIIIRQVNYVNTIVAQDHRAVKRVTRPMLGFNACEAAQATRAGIALRHRLKKRQLVVEAGAKRLTAAELFYSLTA
jgi:transposase-like protein